jgi:hypothetical protein
VDGPIDMAALIKEDAALAAAYGQWLATKATTPAATAAGAAPPKRGMRRTAAVKA